MLIYVDEGTLLLSIHVVTNFVNEGTVIFETIQFVLFLCIKLRLFPDLC